MLIIVEGPDGAGKSTLVAKLRQVIEQRFPGEKTEVLRKGPPVDKAHPLDDYERPLFTYRPGQQHHIICDRWHWGEWIYPDVLGRRTKANRATWLHLEMFVQSRGALVVYMNEAPELLEARIRERGDDLIKPEQIAKISQRYDFVAHSSMTPMWNIIPHSGRIIEYARTLETRYAALNGFTTYVGTRFPNWVLVGDVRNATYEGDPRPAFMPYNATSGHYLLSHLRQDYVNNGLGFINANDVDDVERFVDMNVHHDVRYLALGQNAHITMKKLGVHAAAPHPQYIRRFHHSYGRDYTDALWNAAHDQEDIISWRP